MALVRGCYRCSTGYPIVTLVRSAAGPVEVRLCAPCRHQAAADNRAAKARCSGTDPVPGLS